MISFLCSHCGVPLRVRRELAGTTGRCPRCGWHVDAPLDADAASPVPGGASTPSGRESRGTFELGGSWDGELDVLRPAQGSGELGRLGGYRILAVIGSGGMGIVYRAEDLALKRLVALKVLKKAFAVSPEFRLRFLREAQSAAAIEHDHIVTIYQVGEDRGVPFLAMKLLLGESLEQRLNREGKLAVPELLRIGQEIAEGLAEAHERGLIHRDIKPANVWLEEGRDRVKILDFGLALDRNERDPRLTEGKYIVGTPMYMSPEQAAADKDVDPRTDLFSLGGVLYRMSTGTLPFPGKTTMAVLAALASKKPARPRDLNPELPRSLDRLILRLLSKERDERPRSARLVLANLSEVATTPDEEVVELEPVEDEVIELEPEVCPALPGPGRRRPRPRGRSRRQLNEKELERRVIRFAILVGVCVVVLLAYLIVKHMFFRKTEDPESRAPEPESRLVRPHKDRMALGRLPSPNPTLHRDRMALGRLPSPNPTLHAREHACLLPSHTVIASTSSPWGLTPTTWRSPVAGRWPSWSAWATEWGSST